MGTKVEQAPADRPRWTGHRQAPRVPENPVTLKRAARVRRVIEQTLRQAHAAGERCECAITPDMTTDDLRGLGAGCTDPVGVCPVLDRIRRRLGA